MGFFSAISRRVTAPSAGVKRGGRDAGILFAHLTGKSMHRTLPAGVERPDVREVLGHAPMIEIRHRDTGEVLRSVDSSTLEGADLAYAHLEGADLAEANLEGADLSAARLAGARLRSANLAFADLKG